MGINGRRFIDFLLIEHMGKAGTQNGKLKAPHRQLEAFGIGRRLIADAIRETELLGLVECRRAGQRAPSTYTLTWLPLHDDSPALDYWRGYRNLQAASLSRSQSPKICNPMVLQGCNPKVLQMGLICNPMVLQIGPKPYPPKVLHF